MVTMIPLHESSITTKQFLVVAAWKQVCGDLILIRLIKQRRTYMSSVYIFFSVNHITKYAYNRTILVRVNHLSIRMYTWPGTLFVLPKHSYGLEPISLTFI